MFKLIAGIALLSLIVGKVIDLSGEEFIFLFVVLFWLILMGAALATTKVERYKPRWHNRLDSPGFLRRVLSRIRPWRYQLLSGLLAALVLSGYFMYPRSFVVADAPQPAQPVAQPEPPAKPPAQATVQPPVQAQAVAKSQAEARAKAQELELARALEQAQADAKELAKVLGQGQAKAKALAEEKARALEQARAQAKAEAQAKAQTEAKAKAEALAKAQAQASSVAILPATAPVKPAQATQVDQRGNLQAAVRQWSKVWAAGEVDQYLAMYSPSFVPADSVTRPQWEKVRRQHIGNAREITIDIADLAIKQVSQTKAEAVFVQNYSARGMKDQMRKILTLEKTGDQWKIVGERAAPGTGQ